MGALLTLTLSDLRQRIRDTSVLIFGLVVPLSLMAVLNLVVGGAMDPELEDLDVAVAAAPGDPIREPLIEALSGTGVVEIRVTEVPADQVKGQVEDGTVDLGIVIPEGFSQEVIAGEGPTITVIEGGGAGLSRSVALAVVNGVVDHLAAGAQASRAASAAGLDPPTAAALIGEVAGGPPSLTVVEGVASQEQLSPSAALVAGQAGLFLIFTVGFGALALMAEREHGTLARLYSMPMPRATVVWSKALVSFLLGLLATSVLLAVGGRLFGADFGSVPAVAVLILCAVLATTALMFIVVKVARTAEQAGMVQSIVALVLGVAGGAFFPLAADGAWARVLDLNPVAAFSRGLGITAGGGSIGDIGVPVLLMLGFALVCGVIARVIPDRGAAA